MTLQVLETAIFLISRYRDDRDLSVCPPSLLLPISLIIGNMGQVQTVFVVVIRANNVTGCGSINDGVSG